MKEKISLSVDQGLVLLIKKEAERQGTTVSHYVERLLFVGFDKERYVDTEDLIKCKQTVARNSRSLIEG